MEIELTNGKGWIEFGFGYGSYLKFSRPLAVSWPDGYGSVAQFLIIPEKDEKYRSTVNSKLNEVLYSDFTDDLDSAYTFIKPLLELLENGKYSLSFSNAENKSFFKFMTSRDNFVETHISSWHLHIPESTDPKYQIMMETEHKEFIETNAITKKYYNSNLLDYTTYRLYDPHNNDFIATQPYESIDKNQVDCYFNEIEEGKRPFAIILRKYLYLEEKEPDGSTCITPYISSNFVLDGHHKLLAYKKHGIYPPILCIDSLPDRVEEFKFDLEAVKDVMYPWQYKHLSQ